MNKPTEKTIEPIAEFILRSTTMEDPADGHLDENDLALLAMNSLSEAERTVIREHLSACATCRQTASQVLRQAGRDGASSADRLRTPRPRTDEARRPQRSTAKRDANEPIT